MYTELAPTSKTFNLSSNPQLILTEKCIAKKNDKNIWEKIVKILETLEDFEH